MGSPVAPADVTTALQSVITAIGAIGALGVAAFGLVDASKAIFGGISNLGLHILWNAVKPYRKVLDATGIHWFQGVRANWINGLTEADQKAFIGNLIRLGLSPDSVPGLPLGNVVSRATFEAAVKARYDGTALTSEQASVLGRFNDLVAARLDAAYEDADQLYRNVCKIAAAGVSVMLSVWAGALISGARDWLNYPGIGKAVLVGLLAVPLAPIAKDLASSLQAAANAVKATK